MVIELNWSKAKSILIIAFILTNVFLAANLLSEENKELSTVKDSFVEDVLEILGRKNISVDAEIPDELPSLNMLNVKYEITDYYNINNKYFLKVPGSSLSLPPKTCSTTPIFLLFFHTTLKL